MEDSKRGRCNSLDPASLCDKEALNPGDYVTFDPEGSDLLVNLEPTPAEVAQCEAEVGTLLSIINELNKKMGSLKAPSEPGDMRSPSPSRPLVPDLLSHRLLRSSSDRNSASSITSKHPVMTQGGGTVIWTKLQDVLSSVEDSISFRRTWAAPITASDHIKHKEHLRAAQENWAKATQILDEMEKEFGISCPLGLQKDQSLDDLLGVDRRESSPRTIMQKHQEELQKARSSMEEEKNKFFGFNKACRSGSHSPSYRPPAGALSPDWASSSYPGSPLPQRRSSRAVTPLSLVGDASSLSSVSPCPSPVSLESETERLSRCIERLKAKNERLTAALERRKGESEQNSLKLTRLESECSALQMALRYSEECEEAYSELLSLYEAKRQQNIPLQTDSAEPVGDRQQTDNTPAQLGKMGTEELSTSFSTAGVTEDTLSLTRTPEKTDREAALRQQIKRLQKIRADICVPKPDPGVESKLSPENAPPAGTRWGQVQKEKPVDKRKEKAAVFHELISVREEMSDMRALIRLKEKELRCLEWSLMGQKAQEAAGVFIPERLREEVEHQRNEQQRFCEAAAKAGCDGDVASPLTRSILKELQAVLQREQALKKRLGMAQDSLSTALTDSAPSRKDNAEQIARLTQAHSKALSSYRQIRRKYREQVWRLEQKVAAMMESQHNQSQAPKSADEELEWRREETIL
uniref:Usher syndrome 1C binding protein 1 n=1 Tax=Nothobranchius kadleci TaxID=1051664 RepID=A0A1A8DR05_NOTKA